jgi:type II secretory pathway component PulM
MTSAAMASSPIVRWWSARPPAVQRRIKAASIVVALLVSVFGIAQPLVRSADATRTALARDAAALADARARVADVAALSRAAPAAGDAKRDVDRVLADSGLRATVTQIEWQGARARLTFEAVPFDALVRLLEALQRDARTRVVDAKLIARVEPGTVRAEITLSR